MFLGTIAILTGIGAGYLATVDVHYRSSNCGTAILPADPAKLSIRTGDVPRDAFEQQSIITNCDQFILRQRFIALVPGTICLGCVIAGNRLRRREPPMPGSIFSA